MTTEQEALERMRAWAERCPSNWITTDLGLADIRTVLAMAERCEQAERERDEARRETAGQRAAHERYRTVAGEWASWANHISVLLGEPGMTRRGIEETVCELRYDLSAARSALASAESVIRQTPTMAAYRAHETVREVLRAVDGVDEARCSEDHAALTMLRRARRLWRSAGKPGLTPPTESGTDRLVGSPEHVELWSAINEVVVASGGSESTSSVHRQRAVFRVERALVALLARATTPPSGTGEEPIGYELQPVFAARSALAAVREDPSSDSDVLAKMVKSEAEALGYWKRRAFDAEDALAELEAQATKVANEKDCPNALYSALYDAREVLRGLTPPPESGTVNAWDKVHVLNDAAECVSWCPTCRRNVERGLNPDGTPTESGTGDDEDDLPDCEPGNHQPGCRQHETTETAPTTAGEYEERCDGCGNESCADCWPTPEAPGEYEEAVRLWRHSWGVGHALVAPLLDCIDERVRLEREGGGK